MKYILKAKPNGSTPIFVKSLIMFPEMFCTEQIFYGCTWRTVRWELSNNKYKYKHSQYQIDTDLKSNIINVQLGTRLGFLSLRNFNR